MRLALLIGAAQSSATTNDAAAICDAIRSGIKHHAFYAYANNNNSPPYFLCAIELFRHKEYPADLFNPDGCSIKTQDIVPMQLYDIQKATGQQLPAEYEEWRMWWTLEGQFLKYDEKKGVYLKNMDGRNATGITGSVSMAYRTGQGTNQTPKYMAWIDGGNVELGSANIAKYVCPVHSNFISGFWIDVTEVTKVKWDEVYNWAITNGYAFDNPGSGKARNHPVQTVDWYDCVKWCNARSEKDGRTPAYYTTSMLVTGKVYRTGRVDVQVDWVRWDSGYRLPTEAEWEKASRGNQQRQLFPWSGDMIQHAQANYFSTSLNANDTSLTRGFHPTYVTGGEPYTSPVGSFAGNGYGLGSDARFAHLCLHPLLNGRGDS